MAIRTYPAQAPDEGTTTLVGAGSASDIFTTSGYGATWRVENNTAAVINVDAGTGTPHAATLGNEAVPANSVWNSAPGDFPTWVAIYGAAGVHVNGTTAAGIVIYYESE